MKPTKVIIIGAGAAGLMAARILKSQKIDFRILESTGQIGGRAQTLKANPPVEYGPEYLHGLTPLTDQLLEEFNLPYYDLKFNYHIFQDGKLKPVPHFWDQLCDVMRDIKDPASDISFGEYLENFDQHSPLEKDLARALSEKSPSEREEIFIKELALISSKPFDEVKAWAKKIHQHDWNHDPSFLGAYSYPKVFDEEVHPPLSFEDTLFFAGEAFCKEKSGTIEGALITGKNAADSIIGEQM